jgi:uncharacterized protein YceH (UPF0502 family)
MHLMCGEVSAEMMAAARASAESAMPSTELETLKAEQARLSEEVAQLRALVERMAAELGMSVDRPTQD